MNTMLIGLVGENELPHSLQKTVSLKQLPSDSRTEWEVSRQDFNWDRRNCIVYLTNHEHSIVLSGESSLFVDSDS